MYTVHVHDCSLIVHTHAYVRGIIILLYTVDCQCVHNYVYMYVHVHIYGCTHTCTHTHTHTHTHVCKHLCSNGYPWRYWGERNGKTSLEAWNNWLAQSWYVQHAVYILQVHFTTVISRTLPSNRPLLGTCTYIIGSVYSQVNAHVHVHVLLESGKFSSMHACLHYIILGERNRRIPREACCSSETMQYRTHSCQFVLNRTNRAIERTILGDIVARWVRNRDKRGEKLRVLAPSSSLRALQHYPTGPFTRDHAHGCHLQLS